MEKINNDWIIIRGGGDLATGIAQKLSRAGFQIVILEVAQPLAIRRQVALSEAIYETTWTVEDISARKANSFNDIEEILKEHQIPVIIDPKAELIDRIRPAIVIDAIVSKKNLGTHLRMAQFGTIAIGPGFVAGKDVDIVIESNRGHDLGRLIFEGSAAPNTGLPGMVGGFDKERVIYAPCDGELKDNRSIGSIVCAGEPLAYIGEVPVKATIDGVLRGILRDGVKVNKGLKVADIDARIEEIKNCFTISDKARNLGGSALEAVLILLRDRCGHYAIRK